MSSIARFRRTVVTAEETDSIIGVARRMRDEKIGCVVVIREGLPVGILTDRDVALRVVAEGREPAKTRVSDVLTYGPATVSETDELETAVLRMRERGVRRLPIVDKEGRVTGIVTADDVMVLLGRELGAIGEVIEDGANADESR
ncbi:MAG: CBS domain-containing protein [Myxococcales bacterium]|nr:CBS domain-containing protein [Myxococcales bacterium]